MARMINLEVTKETKKYIFYTFTMETTFLFGKPSLKTFKAYKNKSAIMLQDGFADTGKEVYTKFLYLQDAINAELNRQGYPKIK